MTPPTGMASRVTATEDGDDYVLNGLERFVGAGPQPDLLWALVRLSEERVRRAPGFRDHFQLPGPGELGWNFVC